MWASPRFEFQMVNSDYLLDESPSIWEQPRTRGKYTKSKEGPTNFNIITCLLSFSWTMMWGLKFLIETIE